MPEEPASHLLLFILPRPSPRARGSRASCSHSVTLYVITHSSIHFLLSVEQFKGKTRFLVQDQSLTKHVGFIYALNHLASSFSSVKWEHGDACLFHGVTGKVKGNRALGPGARQHLLLSGQALDQLSAPRSWAVSWALPEASRTS